MFLSRHQSQNLQHKPPPVQYSFRSLVRVIVVVAVIRSLQHDHCNRSNIAKCQQNYSHSTESCPNTIHVTCPVNAFTTGSLIRLFSKSKRSLPSLALLRRRQEMQESYYYTQVISDVDDTLKSSGGVTLFNIPLGGIDIQYKRNEIYPGVAEFMFQLSCFGLHYRNSNNHPSSIQSRSNTTVAKVAILTARAYEFKVFLEMKPNHPLSVLFRTVGEQHNPMLLQKQQNPFDWGFGPILYGSVMEWILQDRKGLRKFHNFEQLLSLQHTKPEMLVQQDSTTKGTRNSANSATTTKDLPTLLNYIYVGDTGEYDEEAAMAMLQYYPQYIRAVFLHVVSDQTDSDGQQRDIVVLPTKYRNGRPIFYFRTYIGAALLAVQHGYMHRDGLQSIIDVVTTTIQQREQEPNRPPFTSDQLYDLDRDMVRAKDWLRETL